MTSPTNRPADAPSAPARSSPPFIAEERTALESWLDFHRETLAVKCAGLDEAQLRRTAVPPSSLSLLGLVRHMAEVERSWFRRVLDDEDAPPIWYSDEDPDGEFHFTDEDSAEASFAVWRAEIAAARKAAESRSLDDVVENSRGQRMDLRWIYVHMIEEYARHNGHADLLRELIDGVTGE